MVHPAAFVNPSNLWRADSENDAAQRCAWGITGKMGSNAFAEFWPDVKKIIFRKKLESVKLRRPLNESQSK